jgi:molybdopterin-guanine dinucleotide biosynthesis protein A
MREPSVTGIVLAGGRSARFGRDKLAESLDGVPLLQRAVSALGAVCDEVIVAWQVDGEPPALDAGDATLKVVHDLRPGEGPLAGAAAGLAAASAPVALVVGGDMPTLEPALLRGLAALAHDSDATAHALVVGGVLRPLPLALRVDGSAELARRHLDEGRLSLLGLLEALDAVSVPEPVWRAWDPEGRSIDDVDTTADLERLRP